MGKMLDRDTKKRRVVDKIRLRERQKKRSQKTKSLKLSLLPTAPPLLGGHPVHPSK